MREIGGSDVRRVERNDATVAIDEIDRLAVHDVARARVDEDIERRPDRYDG
jgi:hypothetical protein